MARDPLVASDGGSCRAPTRDSGSASGRAPFETAATGPACVWPDAAAAAVESGGSAAVRAREGGRRGGGTAAADPGTAPSGRSCSSGATSPEIDSGTAADVVAGALSAARAASP